MPTGAGMAALGRARETARMGDIGLTYNPATGQCDISLARGDVVLDASPVTPLLISLFADRRAHPSDILPIVPPPASNPTLLDLRRGWAGDALDPLGRRCGSRLWLLERAVHGAHTLKLAQSMVAEAVGWLKTQRGITLQVTVAWVSRSMLGIRVAAGATALAVQQRVG
jgi:phage gp46-like protein